MDKEDSNVTQDGLIEPHLKGRALIDDIDAVSFEGPGLAVWWLGQSGFILKSREAILYVDPYLSEHLTDKYQNTPKPHIRMTACPMRGSDVTHADLVLSTHKHSDHMDPKTIPDIMEASPRVRYVLPRAHKEHVLGWGLQESWLILGDVGIPIESHGVRIIPVPSAHEGMDIIDGDYSHMGYIIEMGGMCVYHCGDCIPYEGLLDYIRPHGVDIAFLAINGRDASRHALGTPGNFTIEEALATAVLAGVKTLVPHHYDMFTFNTVDIRAFTEWAHEAWPAQDVCVMACGRQYTFGG